MTNLRFISDEQIRNAVERDKKELDSCVEHDLCKSALLLAGSIIEAILVDYFLAFPRVGSTSEQVLNTSLANLIDWAEQDGLITQRTKELSTVVRSYRNLIHPGREYRLKEKFDIHTALVAYNLVEIITQDVAENYAKKLGYTSEQAINKVQIDPNCASIFPHMIGKMAPVERVKLFCLIPTICQDDKLAEGVIESFIKLHGMIKKVLPQEIVKTETKKVYNYIHNSSKEESLFYLRFFNDDLNLLEADQKESVISYLLSILESSNESELNLFYEWQVFMPIGAQLNSEEWKERLTEIMMTRLYKAPSDGDKEYLLIFSKHILSNTDYNDYSTLLINKLNSIDWNKWASTWAEFIGTQREIIF